MKVIYGEASCKKDLKPKLETYLRKFSTIVSQFFNLKKMRYLRIIKIQVLLRTLYETTWDFGEPMGTQ